MCEVGAPPTVCIASRAFDENTCAVHIANSGAAAALVKMFHVLNLAASENWIAPHSRKGVNGDGI